MKLKQILLFFILFKYIIIGENEVINSCGADDYKLNYKEPENETFCKDRDNGFCKFVHIWVLLSAYELVPNFRVG